MNKRILTVFSLLWILAMTSCYKDKGNYDYINVNKVNISGIDTTYNIVLGVPFRISPTVTGTMPGMDDTSKYSYEWFFAPNIGDAIATGTRYDISKEHDLTQLPGMKVGDYVGHFRATDKATGISSYKAFKLRIVTGVYEGWLLLNDINGKARLDMLSKVDTGWRFMPDVLASVSSHLLLDGKPISVDLITLKSTTIYITTDKGSNKIDPENFDWNETMTLASDMGNKLPSPGFYAARFYRVPSGSMMVGVDSNAYYYYSTNFLNYTSRINFVRTEGKYFAVGGVGYGTSFLAPNVIYDNTNRRFLLQAPGGSACQVMADPGARNFHYQDPTKRLVHIESNSYEGGDIFALLREDKTNINCIAVLNTSGTTTSVSVKLQLYDTITGAPDLNKATAFAVSPIFGSLLYAVDGKVYSYDLYQKAANLVLDLPGKIISSMRIDATSGANFNRRLAVGYCNPDGSNGVFSVYDIPTQNAPLTLYQSWSGFGKIVKATYRFR
ncbi:PKD-like family lipoprotein [Chitinophaga sp. Cy-1792]|uniref:PKD-like family lipoprotein n=1 Tax=Chitinophaga sp. Cy-1792 TaxID=2608339 RepID=UPI0014217C11|nr:PKD-like family lipoprotein [Chitinophaga sp. Cy-1792]